MTRLALLVLFGLALAPSDAFAEESGEPQSEEQWLVELRHSRTYAEGIERAHQKVDFAYDLGAVAGGKHWDEIHDYYIELARAKGCKLGARYAEGPVKVCHKVSTPQPEVVGKRYKEAKALVSAEAEKGQYVALLKKVLFITYDYGYVQGIKHRGRVNEDELRWTQTFYRSCVSRANDAEHEPVCAREAKRWSDALDGKLRKEVEAHGLPAGRRPK